MTRSICTGNPRSAVIPVFTPPPNPPFASIIAKASYQVLSFALSPPPAHSRVNVHGSLRVVRVRGDGRCLYRAIAKGLAHSEDRRLPEHLERQDADALRDHAYRAMCVDRFKEFLAKRIVEGNLSQYCRQMRAPTFYAGEAEMLALADVLKVPIRVYMAAEGQFRNIVTYGEKYKNKTTGGRDTDVRVLYNGSNHFDALVST